MTLAANTEHGAIGLGAMHCLSARDMAGLRACLADDVVLDWPFASAKSASYRGGDVLIKMFSPLHIFATFELSVTDIYELPDAGTVILEARSRGVFGDSRPDYINRYVFILTIADGKITRWREYFNPVEGAKAFGKAEERAGTPVAGSHS